MLSGEQIGFVGPILRINRQRDEFYVNIRDSSRNTKLSLHSSGSTRWAEKADVSREPREAIFRGVLSDPLLDQWNTVLRAIYVPFSEAYSNFKTLPTSKPVEGLMVPGRRKETIVVYSFGYISKKLYLEHRLDPSRINFDLHVFDMASKPDRLAVVTGSYYALDEFWRSTSKFCRKSNTPFYNEIYPSTCGKFFDISSQFINTVNTHSLLFIHSVENSVDHYSAFDHFAAKMLKIPAVIF